MVRYNLRIKCSAEKEFKGIPKSYRKAIVSNILKLATNPKPHDSEKLSGREAYRVVYTIDDAVVIVEVIKVAHRKDVYR
ncbi:MAG: type II toxin-antitoxin system RelE/ParE family toxin [Myxococcales bacterium]|nr:MAG: type II toxin-antitoxin system RelE/ParE family toxin [Myxococcales bacterium]